MKVEDWSRLAAEFDRLCDLPAAERARELAAWERSAPLLAKSLRGMLEADAATGGVLAEGVDALESSGDSELADSTYGEASAITASVAAGDRFGPWRLVEPLGAGGMGEVWAGERADGTFSQRVAIKVLRRGFETEALMRRFLLERQILARLVHPGIARLLDAGTAPDGRPYFVMEHVAGEPITAWARARGLTIGARIALVVAVAEAVDFAHRALVVHRDLKPSNVLVTAAGEVKLLDFGIAKLLESVPGGESTRLEDQVLTPAYAAPEQIRGEPVTTATDVYSLGVLLYELLAGVLPHRREAKSLPQLLAGVDQEIVERPSLAAARAAGLTDRERAARRLTGDLDTILLQALAKEPGRRYPTAAALADDLRRHLAGRPVSARPDSFAYRARKFVGRHPAAVASAVAIFAVGALLTTFYTVRLTRERDRARLESTKAEQVATFLTGLFELSDLDRTRGAKLSARDIVDRGAERIERELAGQPEVEAAMKHLIGSVYRELDLTEPARRLLESALATRRRLFGERHLDVALTERELAALIYYAGEHDPALALLRQALATQESLLGPDAIEVAKTLKVIGYVLRNAARDEEARPAFERAVAILDRAGAEGEAILPDVLLSYGLYLTHIEEPEKAVPLHLREIEIEERLRGPTSPSVGYAFLNLGIAYRMAGDFDAALAAQKRARSVAEATFGRSHTFYANVLTETASDWLAKGNIAEARALYQEAIAIKSQVLGPDHLNTLSSRRSLAILLVTHGEKPAGLVLFEQVLAGRERVLAPDHYRVAESLFDVAKVRTELGDSRDAEAMMRRGLTIFEAKESLDSFDLASGYDDLGEFLCAHGKPEEGRPMVEKAIEIWTENPSAYAPERSVLEAAVRSCR